MAVSAGIYALMALGVNVIWGLAGMVNLGLVGFFAVGAYVSALLTLKLGLPIAVGMAAGAAITALVGVLVALVTVRLRGDYLAIVTLGFAETIRIVASNTLWLTNGTDGISGIAGPYRSRLSPEAFNLTYLAIVIAIVAIAYVMAERLRASPFGRVLRAIRDDEQVAAVAGKHVALFKVKAFAIGAAALGGGAVCSLHVVYRARHLRAAADARHQARLAGGRARQQSRRHRRRFRGGVPARIHPLRHSAGARCECGAGGRAARAPDRDVADRHAALPAEGPDSGTTAANSRASFS